MNQDKQVLLLVGSAKLTRSTSETMGTYLIDNLQNRGYNVETLFTHKFLKSDCWDALLSSVNKADIIILAFPLFIDCLPYPVIKSLEYIAEHRLSKSNMKEQRLLCIANCGFPEASHNDTALAICRQFANEVEFKWAGGLALGAGEVINGQPLFKVKRMARNVIKALDMTAESLARGNPIPQKAIDSMTKPLIPRWLYLIVGPLRWKREAKNNGVYKTIMDRPYQDYDKIT